MPDVVGTVYFASQHEFVFGVQAAKYNSIEEATSMEITVGDGLDPAVKEKLGRSLLSFGIISFVPANADVWMYIATAARNAFLRLDCVLRSSAVGVDVVVADLWGRSAVIPPLPSVTQRVPLAVTDTGSPTCRPSLKLTSQFHCVPD